MRYSPIPNVIPAHPLAEQIKSAPEKQVSRDEASFHEKIIAACDAITSEHRHMILLTGPSASGKTTSAQKIAQELRARGNKVGSISLDNFYMESHKLPKWQDGYQNYESVEGLDLDYFDECISTLLKTGRAQLPIFDFSISSRAVQTIEMTYDEHTYLIFEGIHALNPAIADVVKDYPNFRIYISAHSEFAGKDGEVLLSARDLRLIRRILRDFTYRNTTAEETLRMWDYVLMGEDLYIRPFRENADMHIDSTHAYEPFLYNADILLALSKTVPDSPYQATIQRLRAAAEHFFPLDAALVPADSLIQEFLKQQT